MMNIFVLRYVVIKFRKAGIMLSQNSYELHICTEKDMFMGLPIDFGKFDLSRLLIGACSHSPHIS